MTSPVMQYGVRLHPNSNNNNNNNNEKSAQRDANTAHWL